MEIIEILIEHLKDFMIFTFLLSILIMVKYLINTWNKPFLKKNSKNLNERIDTWFYILIIFYICTISKISITLLFLFISVYSLLELFNIYKIKTFLYERRLLLFIQVVNYILVYLSKEAFFLMFIPSIMILTLFLRYEREKKVALSLLVSTYLLSFIPLMMSHENGIQKIVYFVVLIQLNDIYQYVSGNKFGKIKIAPKISPNKTLAGVIGGMLLTTLTMFSFNLIFPITINPLLGPFVSLLGFFGDILVSAIKRENFTKDTGRLLRGHGGILDRVDSLLLTSIFIFLISLRS